MREVSVRFIVTTASSLVVVGLVWLGWWQFCSRRRRLATVTGSKDDDVVMDDVPEMAVSSNSDQELSDIEDTDAVLAAYRGHGGKQMISEEDAAPEEFLHRASHTLSLDSLKKRVLVLGLDGAGKTTLLAQLTGQLMDTGAYQPTVGVKMVDMATRNCTFNIWEIGGSHDMRPHWEKFFDNIEQLLFVVDGCSSEARLALARSELERVMGDSRLDGIPLLLVVTHQDRLESKTPDEVAHRIKLHHYNDSRQVCQAVGVSLHIDQPPEGLAKLRSWMFPVMAHALQVQDDIEDARHAQAGHNHQAH